MGFDFSSASDATTDSLAYFFGHSEDYETYRPVHPPVAIDAILAGLRAPAQLVAADVGAGTGIGARLLANQGIRVMAIEPNADMRLVATTHTGVTFLEGAAEALPLEPASVALRKPL
ncbi:MAG: methyltransferase domain-containing protein [Cyanobacteria bacterium J06638_22]